MNWINGSNFSRERNSLFGFFYGNHLTRDVGFQLKFFAIYNNQFFSILSRRRTRFNSSMIHVFPYFSIFQGEKVTPIKRSI